MDCFYFGEHWWGNCTNFCGYLDSTHLSFISRKIEFMCMMGLPWTSYIYTQHLVLKWLWHQDFFYVTKYCHYQLHWNSIYLYFRLEYNLTCKWPPWKPDAQNPLKLSSRTCDSWLWIDQQTQLWRSSLRCVYDFIQQSTISSASSRSSFKGYHIEHSTGDSVNFSLYLGGNAYHAQNVVFFLI